MISYSLSKLIEKIEKKQAFIVVKKKITKDDLKLIFADKELRMNFSLKSFTFVFGAFMAISGFFLLNVINMGIGLVIVVISLLMENANKVFLKNKIKSDTKKLVDAYEKNLVSFYIMGGVGVISCKDTQIE